ncbi:MAG: GvpL/GvpF family gas vesicle protein [Solirubrobacterales bacterium]
MSEGVLYVYAVTDFFPDSLAVAGLLGAPLRSIGSGPVAAIYSEHGVAPEPDEDLLWSHEQIVEALMASSTILPMRFGSTVENPEALADWLKERREEFSVSLRRVRGAVELSVRALLPKGPEAEESARPAWRSQPGTAYLLERARRQRRSEDAAERIHRPLAALARGSVLTAGAGKRDAFKAAYLVDEESVEAFGERVGELNSTLADTKVSCTGPWPPYSFVSEAQR